MSGLNTLFSQNETAGQQLSRPAVEVGFFKTERGIAQ